MQVTKNGKFVSQMLATTALNAVFATEVFLSKFPAVDRVARYPMYLDSLNLVPPGYHDLGFGRRMLYVGPEPRIADSTDTINVLGSDGLSPSDADRTNAVAAALTVLLRHHWPGEKPSSWSRRPRATPEKARSPSSSAGRCPRPTSSYENIDWPMQSQFQRQVRPTPTSASSALDNVRLDSAGGRARSSARHSSRAS